MKEHYHHGNLKNDLIENGIKIIAEKGTDALSLRGLSALCGVSHNAIYNHFESKEKMINACREYAVNALTEYLEQSIGGMPQDEPDTIDTLSYAYIDFFAAHPSYFHFIYGSQISSDLVFSFKETTNNYQPFELFRKLCITLSARYNLTETDGVQHLVKYWALMQGLTSLVISPNVHFDGNYKDYLKGIFSK